MTNHVHLVVMPDVDSTLARAMQAVQSRFMQRQNGRYHCGTSEFVEQISNAIGRPLQAKPRGRPRKNTLWLDADD